MLFFQTDKDIKITLEKNIFDSLERDLFTLGIENLSELISSIVLAYCKDSNKLAKEEEKISKNVDNQNNAIITTLLSNNEIRFKKSLLKLTMNDFPKRENFKEKEKRVYKWAITKKAYEELVKDSRSHPAPDSFIKELLKEYVTFSIAQKESVVFAQAIEEIEKWIENNVPFEYVSKSENVFIMHPHSVEIDPDLQYTYVIGHSAPKERYDYLTFEATKKNIKNIRLINLKYNTQHKSWVVPRQGEKIKTNCEAIAERLQEGPVAFISEPVYDIKVLLNEWGEKTYKSIIQNRPKFISRKEEYVDGFKEYTFRCTIFQAVIYFMNFEDSAKIISPVEAVESIKLRLEKTCKMYQ